MSDDEDLPLSLRGLKTEVDWPLPKTIMVTAAQLRERRVHWPLPKTSMVTAAQDYRRHGDRCTGKIALFSNLLTF